MHARQRLAEHIAASKRHGWGTQVFNRDWVPNNAVCLYLYDIKTGYLLGSILNASDLIATATEGANCNGRLTKEIRDTLGAALSDLADGSLLSTDRADLEQTALHLAALYAGGTQTYKTSRPSAGYSFCVLLYRHDSLPDVNLRPFAFNRGSSEVGLLSPQRLYSHFNHVVATDKVNHPEWLLPCASILPFPKPSHERTAP
jgi:hypothetical protein